MYNKYYRIKRDFEMILNNLPKNIVDEVFKLIEDQQFQKRFSEDKVLDMLQAQKHNKDIEFQQLQLLLYKKNIIDGIAFKPITLALYSYLYSIKSNIVFKIEDATIDDLDEFFYILQTGNYEHDIKQLVLKSDDYCNKELHLAQHEAIKIFNRLYQIQFKVFSLFPRISNEGEEPIFNVDWMLNIISKIKPYVSYTTEELYTKVSVMQIYYYYAQYLRNNGSDSIFIRSEQQILDEMDNRTIDLVLDRLIQKQIIKQDQRKEYFDLMKQNEKEDSNG